MSRPTNRKSKTGQKRKRKKQQQLRTRAGSPYRLAGQTGELVAAYVNRNWKDDGIATIHVLRRIPGSGNASASFLVDVWCTGLKDAWGRLDITADEFRENIVNRVPEEIELVRVDFDLVKRIVAGGIRFARENGFRLPHRYKRWTALLGDLGDDASADLTDFGYEGGLHYIGTLEDLKKRLVGCTADELLRRAGVHFTLRVESDLPIDDAYDGVQQATELAEQRILQAARQWCFANGVAPHRRLPDACQLVLEAILQTPEVDADAVPGEAEIISIDQRVEAFFALEGPATRAQLQPAIEQLGLFMQQFASPEEFLATIDLEEP